MRSRWIMVALIALCAAHAYAAPIELRGERWTIQIDPETLAMNSVSHASQPLPISAPQRERSDVAELKADARAVRWSRLADGVVVECKLETDDSLTVHFTASKPGDFAWPIVPPSADFKAYILPSFEGVYVPTDDAEWAKFLMDQGPLDTTAGLSMPFWGVHAGDRSLTYIATNEFNNELAFSREDGRLAAAFTHAFTPNHDVKEYGFHIHLGDSSPVTPAKVYRRHLVERKQFVSLADKIKRTPGAAKLLGAAHINLWGDGMTPEMIQTLADADLDRLWLGCSDWSDMRRGAAAVRAAMAKGYLIAPYDSYHSIHKPNEPDTWETAQFDAALYESGPIVRRDGTKRPGFKKRGYLLSPRAARPYVERRVAALMKEFACNAWFIDCDGAGEVFDDYSPSHPATQAQDVAARLSRMAWIRDSYGVVIASEGGSAYAASTIHAAHGIMTPVIGWGDPDLTQTKSPYFLGRYYPPEAPAVVFKQVPMKPAHQRVFANPRFRLPLYELVFHDSVVATHHEGYGSLKFIDDAHSRELLELLYNVPPLYHLNLSAWRRDGERIAAHYQFFSPVHRLLATTAMTDFEWLTTDRMVQRAQFGDQASIFANFSEKAVRVAGVDLPARSSAVRWLKTGETKVYAPTDD